MLNIDIGRYSSILKEIERNEASIFLIKKNGQYLRFKLKLFK